MMSGLEASFESESDSDEVIIESLSSVKIGDKVLLSDGKIKIVSKVYDYMAKPIPLIGLSLVSKIAAIQPIWFHLDGEQQTYWLKNEEKESYPNIVKITRSFTKDFLAEIELETCSKDISRLLHRNHCSFYITLEGDLSLNRFSEKLGKYLSHSLFEQERVEES
jgi:predicted phosphoadenosine phosphosulfate sulfurtransferase